ncbi:MAG: DUF2336 domain-containing protein [Bradyrhizobium sp.]|uniref:DUF2336 domain-containing protein n=1 Tax=Bradyrhizobium sp. TaxID=376 RepID=UPI001DA3B054|nr:DUF2336 domain-containing protein [Bradyrhizobium sp.]MBV9563823.1 DUF2336 domain-containing protein [Bradyrhizobium sp.]
MIAPKSFLRELDDAILRGSAESREKALWYATDLLMVGRFAEEEIWTFGEVIGRLADVIEVAARARLAASLANATHAPMNVVKKLAFDDSIDVAGPILERSERLDAKTLISNIRTKGQPHLLAISKRKSIPSEVTDELVARGNREVLASVVANDGASFSKFSFLHTIQRSGNDSFLAESLGFRKDIPRQMFQQLIAKASADVRRKLAQERPDLIGPIQSSVIEVAGALQSRFKPATEKYFAAKRVVTARHRRGELNERVILEYARDHKIEEVTVGLSLFASLPFNAVEHALAHAELTLILAKAQNLEWETAMALLFLGAKEHCIKANDLDTMKQEFTRLNRETSQKVLSFYRSRRRPPSAEWDQRRLPQLHSV